MPYVQEALLGLTVLAVALGWLKGGRPEREAVAVLIVGCFVSNLLFYVRIRNFSVGDAIGDTILLAGFGWLALRRDRWWLLVVFAIQLLVMVIHLTVVLTPAISARTDISARWGLLALLLSVMSAGVLERRLAGEIPVSPTRRWRPGTGAPLDDPDRSA
jgi:hypothetical protein